MQLEVNVHIMYHETCINSTVMAQILLCGHHKIMENEGLA